MQRYNKPRVEQNKIVYFYSSATYINTNKVCTANLILTDTIRMDVSYVISCVVLSFYSFCIWRGAWLPLPCCIRTTHCHHQR